MLTFLENLSIKGKIFAIVGSIFALLGIFMIFQISELSSKNEEKDANKINIAMLEARRSEKDFLARKDLKYTKLVNIAIVKLDSLVTPYQNEETGKAIHDAADEYSKSFSKIVALMQVRGLDEKSGAEGKLRESVHALEALVNNGNDKTVMVDMLMCRRHEKDFFLRQDKKYIYQNKDAITSLRSHTESSSLPVTSKVQAKSLIDSYDENFGAASKAILDINNEIEVLRTAVHKIEPLIETMIADRESAASAASKLKMLVMLVTISVSVFIAYWIARIISTSLKNLTKVADKLAAGEIDAKVNANTKDEIGQLETSFQKMIDNIKKHADAADKISNGDLTINLAVKSEKDVMPKSLMLIINTFRELIAELSGLTSSTLNGNLNQRGKVDNFQGSYKEVVTGINDILNAVVLPINESSTVLGKMATGDLTVRMVGDYKGDFAKVKDNINELVESFSGALSDVTEAVQATASASNEISSSSEEMAAGAQEQSSQTTEVASAVEQMTKTIFETTKNSGNAAEAAKNSGAIAIEGGKVVEETIEGMNRVAQVVKQSAETVQALGKSSDQIGEIVQVIDDIADQTNLLALNAAIEAARAGEQGRGFAVVADEVRKLAERTTKATKEIATMIRQIQKDTEGAVVSMNRGTEEVEKGKALADKAGQSLKQIISGAQDVVDMSTQVAAASEEQSSAAEQISKNIEAISNVTQESAAGVQQIAHAAEDLNRLTVNLQELVLRFKIDDSTNVNGKSSRKTDTKSQLAVRSNGMLIHH